MLGYAVRSAPWATNVEAAEYHRGFGRAGAQSLRCRIGTKRASEADTTDCIFAGHRADRQDPLTLAPLLEDYLSPHYMPIVVDFVPRVTNLRRWTRRRMTRNE